MSEHAAEAYVTFEMNVHNQDGTEFKAQYDSRKGFGLSGECWNKDLDLFHGMIASCTAFTRNDRHTP